MSPLLSLMQAATVEPLPEETARASTDLASTLPPAITSDGGLDMLQLVLHASLPVQLVMLLLLFASVASWVIIFRKTKMLSRAEREAETFEERFWSGTELTKLYAGSTSRNRETGGMESIFEAGFREFSRQRRVADVRMNWKPRSAACVLRPRASWTGWSAIWNFSPTSDRLRPMSACSARCGAS